jgi:hypothetical protein
MHGMMWSATMISALGMIQPTHVSDQRLALATARGATVLPVAVFEVLSDQLFPNISKCKRSRRLPDFISSSDGSTTTSLSLPTRVLMTSALKEFNALRRRVRVLPTHMWAQLAVNVAKQYGWEIPVVPQKVPTENKVEGMKRIRSVR